MNLYLVCIIVREDELDDRSQCASLITYRKEDRSYNIYEVELIVKSVT